MTAAITRFKKKGEILVPIQLCDYLKSWFCKASTRCGPKH